MKKEDVLKFNEMMQNTDSKSFTVYQAKELIDVLKETVYTAESLLASLAVEHQIYTRLKGPYGASRWVILEDEDNGWNDYQAGEWLASAASC